MDKNLINRRFLSGITLSVLGVVCFTLASFSMTGCSTVKGLGQDIQHASDATADAINGDN